MRISDWSSDVCSSDLVGERFIEAGIEHQAMRRRIDRPQAIDSSDAAVAATAAIIRQARRSLHVYSRELDPGLPDAPSVPQAMRAMKSDERRDGQECCRTVKNRVSQGH